MKKTLLTLVIAAVGALQAHAQNAFAPVNPGFEDTTHTTDSLTGWSYTGQVNFPNSVSFNVGSQTQTQIPFDGSTRFLQLRAKKQDTGTLYNRGIIRQKMGASGKRPAYFQFVAMYVPGAANSDAMLVRVVFTKFNFTTAENDTVGTAVAATQGGAIYPWTKLGMTINYTRNDPPDSVLIEFWANAANTLHPNTSLFLDDIRFEDRIVTGVKMLNQNVTDYKVFPNPMTSSATISYTLAESSNVNIAVYDISGRLVKTVFNGNQVKGMQRATFERGNLNPGMYIYKIQAGAQVETGKIMITE
jgi:hypothetical protein